MSVREVRTTEGSTKENVVKTLSAFFLSAAAVVGLTGCDQLRDYFTKTAIDNDPMLVFSPGFRILVDGKSVPVAGFDACPKADPLMNKIFGDDPLAGSHDCIVLSKVRKDVRVQVGDPKGVVTEQWTIVRETRKTEDLPYSRTSLKRPDGSLIVHFKS
jgi:hypothetical protein